MPWSKSSIMSMYASEAKGGTVEKEEGEIGRRGELSCDAVPPCYHLGMHTKGWKRKKGCRMKPLGESAAFPVGLGTSDPSASADKDASQYPRESSGARVDV